MFCVCVTFPIPILRTLKSPLKPKNIRIKAEEEDIAVKRSAKKSRRVLDSSDEEGGRENEMEEEGAEMRKATRASETKPSEPVEVSWYSSAIIQSIIAPTPRELVFLVPEGGMDLRSSGAG